MSLQDYVDNFSKYMNPPESPNGEANLRYINGEKWVHCPYCGKKAFPVGISTTIRKLKWKCGNSKCKCEYEINI